MAALNVTPLGRLPLSVSVAGGVKPVVVTVNVPDVPTVKVVLLGLVMAGKFEEEWVFPGLRADLAKQCSSRCRS